MKRIFMILLAVCILVSLCACSSSVPLENPKQTTAGNDEATVNQTEGSSNTPETNTGVQVTLESCRFADEVRAADSECATTLYENKEGKVYIDTVLTVRTDSTIEKDAFAGYVVYDDLRYDLQFCADSYTGVSVDEYGDGVYYPGARVHMFTSVPDAAEGADIEVVVTVNGKEFTSEVAEKDTRTALEQKTELKIGDKKSFYDGLIEFEVVSCKYTKILRGQDVANSKQYSGTKPFIDLVLKVTNNATGEEQTLGDAFFSYTIVEGEIVRGETKVETNNNTDLKFLSLEGIAPGTTEYIHVYSVVEETQNMGDLMIRMNFGESCFYCYAEQE